MRSGYASAYWIGSRMSGGLSWAFTDPSTNSTMEWMMLCGWMTISISSHGTPNSQWASITSNALFISVAESTVIFLPIDQVGWRRACSGVTEARSLTGVSLKAPPDPVMMSLDTDESSPRIHCHIALGSLSSGNRSTPCAAAFRVTISPAITIVSLFATAICLPADMAASVGAIATSPSVAVTTMSTSSSHTRSMRLRSMHPPTRSGAFSALVPPQLMNFGQNS